MPTLSNLYKNPLRKNKMHLMKKLFNLKMAKGTFIAQHLNDFNTNTNQLSSAEIEFANEIQVLILLTSLLNNLEVVRMTLVEKVCRKDSGEFLSFDLALNVDDRGRGHDKLSFKNRSRAICEL